MGKCDKINVRGFYGARRVMGLNGKVIVRG